MTGVLEKSTREDTLHGRQEVIHQNKLLADLKHENCMLLYRACTIVNGYNTCIIVLDLDLLALAHKETSFCMLKGISLQTKIQKCVEYRTGSYSYYNHVKEDIK